MPIALAGGFAAQCLWFVGTQSFTYDEPAHLIAGLEAWNHGRFEKWNDQPPLGRLLLTAPLVLAGRGDWRLDDLGPSGANFWTVAIRPDPVGLAWRTRLVNVALGLILAAWLWTTARRLFSTAAATFALSLFACSPALIAHFSLATVDGAATLLCFASATAVVGWRARPSWPRTIGVGLALGGFLAAKFSAPPLVLLSLVLMLWSGPSNERIARTAKTAAALTLALLSLWGTYRWHVGPVTFRNGSLSGPYARGQNVVVPVEHPVNLTMAMPAPEFIVALSGVAQHSARGQPAFLQGEVKRSGGWRRFFPVVVLLKWPLTMWVLIVAACGLFVRRAIDIPGECRVLMLFPSVFFALATMTNLDIGDRYVLPIYPFLLLLCAAVWKSAGRRMVALGLLTALVLVQAVGALRYAPDYLSYFTVLVRPDQSFTQVTDSSLDWGQGLLALRAYERAHADRTLWLAYFGGVDPASYGIRARRLGENDRVHGTVAVSATHLSGQYLQSPAAYHWLLQYPRSAILNHTLYLFEVP